ncbi:MAG: hypothetical protein VKM01_06985 [Cyanobacteriota bacterium]|nr:hypothetical protein [Cyanobacteriota bacterium]
MAVCLLDRLDGVLFVVVAESVQSHRVWTLSAKLSTNCAGLASPSAQLIKIFVVLLRQPMVLIAHR